MFLVLIFTRGSVNPRAMERSEGDMSLKNPVTPPGIDPGTVQLVVQRLNHYATPGPIKGDTQAVLKPVSEIQAQVLCTIMGCLIMTFICIPTCCNETKEVLEGKFTVHFSYINDPSLHNVCGRRQMSYKFTGRYFLYANQGIKS
jgi:hypothetical protein